MTARIDVGIDAQGHSGDATELRGHCRKAVQFARRFCVDRPDVGGNRGLELLARLANAGKDDVFRLEPGALCHLNFTPRIGVNPTAERAQEAQQR